jgi:hypothetical protein
MFGLDRLTLYGVGLALLVLTHGGLYAYGWHKGYDASERVWAAEKSAILVKSAAEAEKLRADGRALAAELEVARVNIRVEYVEKIRTVVHIASRTKGCLSADVTAALNARPIRETVERSGEPPRDVVAPSAGTSEAAAAEWIAGAQAAHEMCRAQVQRLGDWIRSATGSR